MKQPDSKTTKPPLFIPLMGVYYDAFAAGTKECEYRPYGPRWNELTCYKGRTVTLSRGYGKKHRMTKTIKAVAVIIPPSDFLKIYGEGKECLAIQLT